eukprot:2475620-Rhodomonas_salina.1
MTSCDLASAYAELSKFVQLQGPVHLTAAEHALQYLRGTYKEGLVYSDPGTPRRNCLEGWVDSDYALDPDTCKSVTGYVLSLNNVPVSWKVKRQDCMTLSSAEAELVAASMCGQEVSPTKVWEDNATCIQIANNQCAGTHNVADALTKSLPSQTFLLHCPFLTGTHQEYKVFFS